MAMECSLKYADDTSIKGDNDHTDREDQSIVIEVHHEVASPRDQQTGRATGARVHRPLRVLKPLDKATPLLAKALTQNQALSQLELFFYRPNPVGDGTVSQYYTVTIKNARVVKQELLITNTKEVESENEWPMEWVEFGYEGITWKWTDGGIEHEDTWSSHT